MVTMTKKDWLIALVVVVTAIAGIYEGVNGRLKQSFILSAISVVFLVWGISRSRSSTSQSSDAEFDELDEEEDDLSEDDEEEDDEELEDDEEEPSVDPEVVVESPSDEGPKV